MPTVCYVFPDGHRRLIRFQTLSAARYAALLANVSGGFRAVAVLPRNLWID